MITTLLSAQVLLLVGDFVVVSGFDAGEQKTGQCLLQVHPERPLPPRLKEVHEDDLGVAHERLALQSVLHAESKPNGPSKMHRTEMDQDDLASDSRHVHKETYTSDWQDEYPFYAPSHHKVHPSPPPPILPAKVLDAGMVFPAIGLLVLFLSVVACLVCCMVYSRRKTKKNDDFVFGRNQEYDHGYTFHDVHHPVQPVQYHDHQEQYMYHDKVHLEAHQEIHLQGHDELRPPPENYAVPSTSHRRLSPEYTSSVYMRSHPQMVQEHVSMVSTPLPPVKENVTPPGSTSGIEGPLLPSTIPPERERVETVQTIMHERLPQNERLPPAVEFHDAKADEPVYPETSGASTTHHPMGKSRGRENPGLSETEGAYYQEVAREYL